MMHFRRISAKYCVKHPNLLRSNTKKSQCSY